MTQGICSSCRAAVKLTSGQTETNCTRYEPAVKQSACNLPGWRGAMFSAIIALLAAVLLTGCTPPETPTTNPGAKAGTSAEPKGSQASTGATNALPAVEPPLPEEVSLSREAFEARYGKPLFTKKEFDAVFKGLYEIGLDEFLAMLGTSYFGVLPEHHRALADAVRLFGNKSDSLREAYATIVQRVFVSQVRSNSIAESLGLKPGDEVLDAYLEADDPRDPLMTFYHYTHGDGTGISTDTVLSRGPPLQVKFPLAGWALKEFHLYDLSRDPSPQSDFCVTTTRGTLRIPRRAIMEQLVQAYTNKWGLKQAFTIHSQVADIVPHIRNLGAVLETRFEKRNGLDKNAYLASIIELQRVAHPRKSYVADTVDDLARLLEHLDAEKDDPFPFAEPFEGFKWSAIHRCMLAIRPVPDGSSTSIGSGFLGQLWYVRRLVPSLDFAVYRGNGVDSLVFYDKAGVALCIQTLWGSQGGFIAQFVPRHIDLLSLLGPDDFEKINDYAMSPEGRGMPLIDFVPINGIWSPLIWETRRERSGGSRSSIHLLFMPKPPTDGGSIQFEDKPVDISGNPKGRMLLGRDYYSQFDKTYLFFNREGPVAFQFNGTSTGYMATNPSPTKLVTGIVNWPLDYATTGHDEDDRDSHGNCVFAGKNYTGQLILGQISGGYRRARFQVFGRTSVMLPVLTKDTIKAQNYAAAEKEYWFRYVEQTTGRSGGMTPAELLERVNRHRILEQLFSDK